MHVGSLGQGLQCAPPTPCGKGQSATDGDGNGKVPSASPMDNDQHGDSKQCQRQPEKDKGKPPVKVKPRPGLVSRSFLACCCKQPGKRHLVYLVDRNKKIGRRLRKTNGSPFKQFYGIFRFPPAPWLCGPRGY